MAHTPRADAEIILRKSLDKVASEQKYDDPDIKVTPVSTEGANFSSLLFAATIASAGKDDLKLFAKVSAVGEKLRQQGAEQLFVIERLFYSELALKYRELEENHGIPEQHRFKFPKIYDINSTPYEETYVMEDLTAKGYGLHDRFKSVDWNYAAAAFTEIAKMHALSMAFSVEKPDEFKELAKEFRLAFSFESDNAGDLKNVMEQGMQRTIGAASDEHKGRLMAFLGKIMSSGGGLGGLLKFYSQGEFPVIRHGDYRPSNVMHKQNEDGSVDIVVVDFQALLAGNHVIDLYYFIFLGTDKAFRAEYYDQLIAHYYAELSAALIRLGLEPETIYSKQKFDDDMKENLIYGLLVTLNTLALVTVESSEAPEITAEHDVSAFLDMTLSSTFTERLNGILDDFVKWGIL